MHEVIEVARKSGIPLRDELVDEHFTKILALPRVYGSTERCCSEDSLGYRGYFGCASEESQGTGVYPWLEVIYTLIAAVDYGLREGKIFKWIFCNKSN